MSVKSEKSVQSVDNIVTDNLDPIIDAPDGIKCLRELILQLAVQGKLVEQRPEEGTAEELLVQIKSNRLSKKELVDVPFEIPTSWAWSNLKYISIFGPKNGYSPKAVDYPTQTKSLTLSATTSGVFLGEHCKYIDETIELDSALWLEDGDVLFQRGNTKEYVGVSAVYYGKPHSFIYPDLMMKVRFHPEFDIGYLHITFLSESARDYLRDRASGTSGTMPKINQRTLNSLPIPLSPLAEQKRIVAKVDELMAWCDELDALKQKRDSLQRAALKSSLRDLCDLCGENSLARIVSNFSALVRNPADVKQLRDAILQLAVQGRLVPQRKEDGTADELLTQIEAAKATDLARRKANGERIRKTKPLPPITNEEIPFDIPNDWKWVRLGALSANLNYGYTASANHQQKDVRFVRITDIQNDSVNWDSVPGCSIADEKVEQFKLIAGDLLIARTGGTIGKTFLVYDVPYTSVYASYLIRVTPIEVSPEYLKVFAGSDLYWDQLYEKSMGTGQPNVNATSLSQLKLPLPPLAEQQRIVEKVDELMAYCDELETLLQTASSTAARFAAAIARQGGS